MRRWFFAICSAFCLWLAATGAAHADVWGFVDDRGITHFASHRVDDRYELFFKGNDSFDTKDASTKAQTAVPETPVDIAPKVVAPKNASKLVMYFDVSPSFKAVKHHLREASNTHRIDMELLQAVIATESGFDANAVSPKGAVGLMQLIPATAQRYGVRSDAKKTIEQKLTDPQTNIRAGSRYLADLIKMFPGKLDLAVAAYNAGEGAVQRYGNQIPPYKETQNYVKTVMQMYTYLKPPPVAVALKQLPNAAPNRVRVEMAPPVGGAVGRGNMMPTMGTAGSLGALAQPVAKAQESE